MGDFITCLVPRYRLIVPLVVEPSLWQAGRCGTLYRTVSETRLSAAAAASGNYLRRTASTVTQHTQRTTDVVMTLRCVNIQLTLSLTLSEYY